MLARTVVQVLADAGLLAVGDLEDFFFEQPLLGNVAHDSQQLVGSADGHFGLEFAGSAGKDILAGECLRLFGAARSEERRVGKECRYRWALCEWVKQN